MMEILSSFPCGSQELLYLREKGVIGLCLIPSSMRDQLQLEGKEPESMVQFKLSTTPFSGKTPFTLRNSPCMEELRFLSQEKEGNKIITRFRYGKALFFDHIAQCFEGYLRSWLEVKNNGEDTVELDHLSAFSLSFISPFGEDEREGKYFLERVTEFWHHEEISMERAGLEGSGSLRFGTNTTSSLANYYPFAGIEDRQNGILWGVELENTSSFLMEFSCKNGSLSLSGGEPDLCSSGKVITITPGETYRSMSALSSCVKGNILDLFNALQKPLQEGKKESSPICQGSVSPENLTLARELGIKYFLMEGLDAGNIARIREKGLIPGITWDVETLPANGEKEHLLTKSGHPIQVGDLYYRDLRDPEYGETLLEELTSFLKKHEIGYVRFPIPPPFCGSCDGKRSPMENQLEYMESIFTFYAEFKKRMPQVLLEFASPGIQRLTPKWLSIADVMTTLSPLSHMELAMASLDRQMLTPSWKCGIPAPLQGKGDLHTGLNTSLLGRPIFTGELSRLTPEEKKILKEFLRFYGEVQPVLEEGSYLLGHIIGESCINPSGWQVFYKKREKEQLTLFHIFSDQEAPLSFDVPFSMREKDHFSREQLWQAGEGKMVLPPCKAPASGAVLFREEE